MKGLEGKEKNPDNIGLTEEDGQAGQGSRGHGLFLTGQGVGEEDAQG